MKVIIKENLTKELKKLEGAGHHAQKVVPKHIFRALTLMEAQIKQNIRTNFTMRSGSLHNSIQKKIYIQGNVVHGSVGPEGNVPYAATHEFGATIPERVVKPRNRLALKWSQNGDTFFSKGHTIPSFEIPARPYIQPAMDKIGPKVEEGFDVLMEKSLEKKDDLFNAY